MRPVYLCLALTLAACRSRPSPSPSSSSPPPTSSAPTSLPPSAPALPSSSAPAPASRAASPAEQLVTAWNNALDQRDIAALAPLYAPKIFFYGQWTTSNRVTALKRAAFEKQPDFHQRIDDVHISKTDRGFVAMFQKHSGPKLESVVEGRLALEPMKGKLSIVEESDSVTDDKLKKPVPSSCMEAVWQIVDEQPAIQADIKRVAKEFPEANPGGMTYEEDATHVSAAMGYYLPERFDTRWHIEVAKGVLTLTDAYSQQPFPLSTEQRERVRRACSSDENGGQ